MPSRFMLFAAALALPLALGLFGAPLPGAPSAHAQTETETITEGASLVVSIKGVRASLGGRLYIGLFDNAESFPERSARFRQARADVEGPRARVEFEDLPPGRYAIAIFHDENGNAMFDQGLFGIPLEGFGFSRDAEVMFGSPSFDDAAFSVTTPETTHTLRMRYGL